MLYCKVFSRSLFVENWNRQQNCAIFQHLNSSTSFIWYGDLIKRFLSRKPTKRLLQDGEWNVSKTKFLGFHRPKSTEEADVFVSPNELEALLEIKRERIQFGDCLKLVVGKRGAVGTSQRILTNHDETIDMMKKTEAEALQTQEVKTVEEQRKEEECQGNRKLRREKWRKFDARALTRRLTTFSMLDILPRPNKIKIVKAKEFLKKRNYVPLPIKHGRV